jgi:uncharacterized membrane protein YccC
LGGASTAIVCQPQLEASLPKGWFRMIGTVIGATFVAAPASWFPQDRFAFLGHLARWRGLCAFAAFASTAKGIDWSVVCMMRRLRS